MNKAVAILVLSLLTATLYAQKINYSKPIKLNNKTPNFKLLGRNANYFIAERWGKTVHYLDTYNADLNKISSKEIKFSAEEKLKKIWIQPQKGWIISTVKVADIAVIKAQQLDANLNVKTTPLYLDTIIERTDLVETNLRIALSLNEKYLACYMPVFSKGVVDYFIIHVYNQQLEKLQTVKLKNETISKANFSDIIISNQGDVIIIFKDENALTNYTIYYAKTGTIVTEHSVKLEFEVFKNLKFEFDNKNMQLLVTGLRMYQENKRTQAADAFFTFVINLNSGEKSSLSTLEFTKEFFKLLTDNESKTEKVSLQTFYINKVLPKTDGSFLVFLESYYENEEIMEVPQSVPMSSSSGSLMLGNPSFSPSTTYKTNYYFYNDVIVYSVDTNFQITDVNIIKKRQKSQEDNGGYSSFYIVNQQNLLEVLFLDEINTNASLKRYTLNNEVEIFKDYVINVGQNNVMPVVKQAIQTAPNEVLIPSYLNNAFSIIKIIFEDNL
jgi:hypothetical protein